MDIDGGNGSTQFSWLKGHKRLVIIVVVGLILIGLTSWLVWSQSTATETASSNQTITTVKPNQAGIDSGITDESTGGTGNSTITKTTTPAGGSGSAAGSSSSSGTTGTGSASSATATTPTLTTIVGAPTMVASHTIGSASASCPTGTIAVGGGFNGKSDTQIWGSYPGTNNWSVNAYNQSSQSLDLRAYVQCVAHLTGTITTLIDSTLVSDNASGTINKDCPTGTSALSGGFTAEKITVTFSSKVNNGWRVNATNNSGQLRALSVYTNCYSVPVDITQLLASVSVSAGSTSANTQSCTTGLPIMNGFAFNSQTYQSYYQADVAKWLVDVNNQTSSALTLKAYLYCSSFVPS